MPFWLYLTGFLTIVLAIAAAAIVLGARFAPEQFSPLPLVWFLVAVFGLAMLPLPSSLEVVPEYIGMAGAIYFLYRSGPVLKGLILKCI